MDNKVSEMVNGVLENLKGVIDSSTIIGNAVDCGNGVTVIPVSKVSIGLGSGGLDYDSKNANQNFGGGLGAGLTVSPVAFLVASNGKVEVMPVEVNMDATSKLVGMIPGTVDTIVELIQKYTKKQEN